MPSVNSPSAKLTPKIVGSLSSNQTKRTSAESQSNAVQERPAKRQNQSGFQNKVETLNLDARLAAVNGLPLGRLVELYNESQDILDFNKVTRTIGSETYHGTMPSREFYVHQWCWDSATHAMGLAETDPARALDELASLCLGQWDNGLIPQLQFFPEPENGRDKYFPSYPFWRTDNRAPKGIKTSGITQPPIIGLATPKVAYAVLKSLPSNGAAMDAEQLKTFSRLTNVLGDTFKFLKFLRTDRDPEESGLITVVHPWESGLDNAPQWDNPLKHEAFDLANLPPDVKELVDTHRKDVSAAIDGKKNNADERPEQKKYYDYMSLVKQFQELGWDQVKMAQESNFRVKDVLFTSIFVAACDDLGQFYRSDEARAFDLDNAAHAKTLTAWADAGRKGLASTWDADLNRYLCEDLNRDGGSAHLGEPIKTDTLSGFSPLLCGLGSHTNNTGVLLAALQDPKTYKTTFTVPTTALNNPAFELKRYWRGCVWPITNFLMIASLKKVAKQHEGAPLASEANKICERLTEQLNQLIDKVGFQEYYMPTKSLAEQEKIGYGRFSWTAAIFLMLNAEGYRQATAQP